MENVVIACLSAFLGMTGDPDAVPATPPPESVLGETRVEATSLLGKELLRPPLTPEKLKDYEAKLAEARAALDAHPGDEDAIIWVGRRLAYLGRYRDAVDAFTTGLKEHPESFKLLRHRGHRYLTTRKFELALADLSKAAKLIEGVADEVEPDGMPNAANTPTSTSHTNIFYHLGLVHYLKGDFEKAAEAYRRCMEFAKNDDMRCATAHWLYMSLRRLKRDDEARAVLEPIHDQMNIIENVGYHRLLLMDKGELRAAEVMEGIDPASMDGAAVAYGVGNWHLCNDEADLAKSIFNQIVAGPSWPAFGHIAAEAELARHQPAP